MTQNTPPLADVSVLLEERRRYHAWLDSLEARRDATPPHVYARVESDYRGRLAQVTQRLAGHHDAVAGELAGLRARLSLLEAEVQLRRDERAEAELRGHVGELGQAETEAAMRSIDAVLDGLEAEQRRLEEDAGRLAEILATVGGAPAGSASLAAPQGGEAQAAAVPEPAVEGSADMGQDDLGFLRDLVEEGLTSAGPTPQAASPAAPAAPGGPATLTPGDGLAPIERDFAPVGQPDAAALPESRPSQAGQAQPYGANVPGSTPIRLRSSGAIEQSKTLKCADCGSANYPTEWYCERCGAELAAL
jgi:hypothetical protein